MKRILVISDVHANLAALEAVLADAGKFDETWCLGDLVGYGPDPNLCVATISELPNLTCLMGNHDMASLNSLPLEAFNSDARKSILWQKQVLMMESIEFLKSLSEETVVREKVSLVHGSPRDPIWEYVLNTLVARLSLAAIQTPWCFVGHSHFQVIFRQNPDNDDIQIVIPDVGRRYKLSERAILNPGSVGQPRDRDPRAAYAIYYPDSDEWEPHRVEYDIASVQKRIIEAGLPQRHAERLSSGV